MLEGQIEIIAEIGSVHDGSFGNAINLVKLSAQLGATVVKFQHHIAESESVPNAPSPNYFNAESRYDYFKRTSFTKTQWEELYLCAKENGIKFGSSVFSLDSLDQLLETNVDIIKIPSGEVTNISLLRAASKSEKPIHVSSGMSNYKELDKAIEELSNAKSLTLFQCTSMYPTPPERIGLNLISKFSERYGLPIGLSDHSLGHEFGVAAVALGAVAIEKHLTFSRRMYGSDAFNALEPNEFLTMVNGLKNVWKAIASPVDKDDTRHLSEMRKVFQKSIAVSGSYDEGHILKFNDLIFLKPGIGIPADQVDSIVGRRLKRSVQKNDFLKEEDLA